MIFSSSRRIFIKPGFTDLRKSINGLSTIVQEVLAEDPFSEAYFVFCNRRRNLLKIVYWDRNGYCLWLKRLEEDKFSWPRQGQNKRELKADEFKWLLDGLDFDRAHKSKRYVQ